jgi:glycosyltransferase involved in cell wall biosynthesis
MATYNGERFIHEQLSSILAQLNADDEIVVVDDASSDQTLSIVEGFCDRRIRIIRQPRNSGILKTFGRALQEARGEIVFLSDQDDVWRPDKVSKISSIFAQRPEVSLVISDCSVIDAAGNVTLESRHKATRFYLGAFRNIVSNRYLGCAMAFRRSTIEYCLPFPADIPQHDMWIGIVNQFVGRAEFINEPLFAYRRHDRNGSPGQHAPIVQMIRWRWSLVKNLSLLGLQRVFKPRKAPAGPRP